MKMNVLQMGAVGDGVSNDGPTIQSAIDLVSKAGGGQVILDGPKVYYSSSLMLKENIDLHIEKGAVLKAHGDIATYLRPNNAINDESNTRVGNPVIGKPSFVFIYGKDADNITISGEGTIDGNAYAFVKRTNRYYVTGDFYPRPTLIYTENCNHATFKDVRMVNAPFWTLHPAGSDDVLIRDIRILNDLDVANSDGIDPDHCTNVRILGCHITCADDCICIKNTNGNKTYHPSKNIVISDCTLVSTSAAIKIGTEGVNDFENILVHDCLISSSNRGLSIQIRDEGSVKNVRFHNIVIDTRRFSHEWWGCGEPIVLTSHNRDSETNSGTISHISFKDISCDSENGIFVSSSVDRKIHDISFDGINLRMHRKSKWPLGQYDLRPYPYENGIIEKKSPGIWLRHTDNIFIRNMSLWIDPPDIDIFGDYIEEEECYETRVEKHE